MAGGSISIQIENLRQLVADVQAIEAGGRKAISSTVKDVKARAPGWIAQEVTAVYNIKKGEITPSSGGKPKKMAGSIRITGETIEELTLVYKGRLLTPVHFGMTPKAPPAGRSYTLKAQILKGSKKVIGRYKNTRTKGGPYSQRSHWILMGTGNTKADGTPYDIYRDGLKIYTTIDSRMQEYAEQSIQKQMESVIQPQMDAQFKRTKTLFIDANRQERERIMRNAIRYSDRYYQMQKAGVDEKTILASFDKPCPMKVFTYKGERDTVLTPRDSILHHKRIMRASFVAMDPRSGHVKAYVGGPNFRYFKYDMAKQGKRQIGSTIKPFVYTFAIDHLGLTPCTMVPNLPVTIETANGTAWSPKEAGKVEQNGEMHPLSWGLARSRNNYSAWIMKQAKQPQAVANFIHNMGIHSYIDPVPALCLGTSESNVYEMVSAFSTFANEGVYTTPIFVTRIEDRQGNLIASFAPRTQDAISERTAYTMLTMLEGVIRSGTGGRLGWAYNMQNVEVGGKTGTSQKNRDAWFMCVLPKLVAGCWVGGEDQAVRLVSRGEGSVIALPIVGEFLNRIYADPSTGISKQDLFTRPAVMPVYDCDETEKTDDSAARYEEDEFFE